MPEPLSQNRINYLASLRHKKHRQLQKKFVIEGARLCEEALHSDFIIEEFYYTAEFADSTRGASLLEEARINNIETIPIADKQLAKFSETIHSQGIAALLQIPPPKPFPSNWPNSAAILALDAISDPGNLGTIIRTADWFAVDSMLLGRGCVELYNPKVVRSTMGSLFHLPIYEDYDLKQELQHLKSNGFTICAGDAHKGASLDKFMWPQKTLLLIGSEARGIDETFHPLIDELVHIPKLGGAESLNVATAVGILMFSISVTKKMVN